MYASINNIIVTIDIRISHKAALKYLILSIIFFDLDFPWYTLSIKNNLYKNLKIIKIKINTTESLAYIIIGINIDISAKNDIEGGTAMFKTDANTTDVTSKRFFYTCVLIKINQTIVSYTIYNKRDIKQNCRNYTMYKKYHESKFNNYSG